MVRDPRSDARLMFVIEKDENDAQDSTRYEGISDFEARIRLEKPGSVEIMSRRRGDPILTWTGITVDPSQRSVPETLSRVHEFRVGAVFSKTQHFFFHREEIRAQDDDDERDASWLGEMDDFGAVPLCFCSVEKTRRIWEPQVGAPEMNSLAHFIDLEELLSVMQERFGYVSGFDDFPVIPMSHDEFLDSISDGGIFDPMSPRNNARWKIRAKWVFKKQFMFSSQANLLMTWKYDLKMNMEKWNLHGTHPFVILCVLSALVASALGTEMGFKHTVCEALRDAGVRFESCSVCCAQRGSSIVYAAVFSVCNMSNILVCLCECVCMYVCMYVCT